MPLDPDTKRLVAIAIHQSSKCLKQQLDNQLPENTHPAFRAGCDLVIELMTELGEDVWGEAIAEEMT